MKTTWLALSFALALITSVASAQPDRIFTYQGELKENGGLANGLFDFDFSLWDSVSAGNQIGSTVAAREVPVVEGKFTVELDFGAAAFDNSNRWLEIEVNGDTLSPRNLITRAPYAIQTRGIFVDGNHEVGIGTTLPDDQLHLYGEAPTLRLEDNDLPGSYSVLRDAAQTQAQLQKFNALGNVIFDIDPIPLDGTGEASLRLFRSTNTTGLKRVLFYRGNNTTATSAAIGLDGANSYFQINGGNVGIGTAAPEMSLEVTKPSFYGVPAIGGTNASAHAYLHVGPTHSLIWNDGSDMRMGSETGRGSGYTEHMRITSAGKVGIGTSAPQAELDVNGLVQITTSILGGGEIGLFGTNGSPNVMIHNQSNANRGRITVHNENGDNKIMMRVYQGDGEITANKVLTDYLSADEKYFRIPNPNQPGTDIVYACVEGPEAAAYLRGTATLVNGEAKIIFPDHFTVVAAEEGLTVQLTPRSAESKGLAVVSQSTRSFQVRELFNGTGSYDFHWEVKAVRKGHENFKVIRTGITNE